MTVFDRIKELSDKRGISLQKAATEMGFSENLFYQWKSSQPKADRLEKVADYFHVSTDYLLGRTDDPSPAPKSDEGFLRLNMTDLTDEERKEVEKDIDDIYKLALKKIQKRREMMNRD
ncbi:helix-turn-helix domain-containing protein [Enterococcus asini]|uniref:helix-turn-helix domain-containing protein n=1 Tax=Enterococcus asini TaxID=57732 RepID=UPI00288DE1DB|nr:helix-turn-helix transcriptional regulator [Enterococcus asini]MDT2743977.1 helix-turn-helix transcriptional regulator [Enterococcus asini]